ncbi:hypothetical protein ACQVA2_13690 [Citrobacter sp. OP27]
MQKVWREVTLFTVGASVVTMALLISGCTVVKNESNSNSAVALGGACAAKANADSYQASYSKPDVAKVIKAVIKSN